MTLTAADVAEIMRLVEQSGFDELNLEIDGTKINLRRGTPVDCGQSDPVERAGAGGCRGAPGSHGRAAGARRGS